MGWKMATREDHPWHSGLLESLSLVVVVFSLSLPWIVSDGPTQRDIGASDFFSAYRTASGQGMWSLVMGYGCYLALALVAYAAFLLLSGRPVEGDKRLHLRIAGFSPLPWMVLVLIQASDTSKVLADYVLSPGGGSVSFSVGPGAYLAACGALGMAAATYLHFREDGEPESQTRSAPLR
jgi:hypothetical protein